MNAIRTALRKQHARIILCGLAVFSALSIDQHTELFLRNIRTAQRRKVAYLKAPTTSFATNWPVQTTFWPANMVCASQRLACAVSQAHRGNLKRHSVRPLGST